MQQVYISLLRGINVGGNNLIKMQQLITLYEALHFKNVTSYIQSGNIIFVAPKSNTNFLATLISKQIQLEYGLDINIVVFNLNSYKKIIHHNPFLKDNYTDIKKIYIAYFSNKPTLTGIHDIENIKHTNEVINITNNAAYIYYSEGYANTKLNNKVLENKLKVIATTRNWNTSLQILEIANNIKI